MNANRITDDDCIHIVGTVKDRERYIVYFDTATKAEALRVLGKWAGDPELSFNWYDAAQASQRIRTEV